MKGVFSQALEVLLADSTQLPAPLRIVSTAEYKALHLPKAAYIHYWCGGQRFILLPPIPDNSEGSPPLQSSLWDQLRSPLRLLCRPTGCNFLFSCLPVVFSSFPQLSLDPKVPLIHSLDLISISDPASQGIQPAKQTCDLLLNRSNMARVMDCCDCNWVMYDCNFHLTSRLLLLVAFIKMVEMLWAILGANTQGEDLREVSGQQLIRNWILPRNT